MPQGVVPFQYQPEREATGMTSKAGLGIYLDLAEVAGMRSSMERLVGLRNSGRG